MTPTDDIQAADPIAAAERLMAVHLEAQRVRTVHVGHDRRALRLLGIAGGGVFAAVLGAVMGQALGHPVALALLMGLVGTMLAAVAARPR